MRGPLSAWRLYPMFQSVVLWLPGLSTTAGNDASRVAGWDADHVSRERIAITMRLVMYA